MNAGWPVELSAVLTAGAQHAHELSGRREPLDAVIPPIRDPDAIFTVDGDAPRKIELTKFRAECAERGDKGAIRGQLLYACVQVIDDVEVAFGIDRDSGRPVELGGPGPQLAPAI